MSPSYYTRWISPSPIEDEIRSLLVQRITLVVSSKFRDAQVLPFGSYATKLYLPTGDINLVIMSETMRNNDKNAVFRSLAEVIKRNGIASNVSIIAKARVPIIKLVTTHGHIPVDISINQGNGSVALRALVMITKMFLSQRGMNEVYTGGLGSYAIVSLIISFLQMHPKIRRGEIDADRNLGVLLIEFFELYGSYFNYENVGISVRDGGTYFHRRQRGWYNDNNSNYKGRGGVSSISIEDPIDISNDISSGSYGFAKVRATFAGVHQIPTATAYLKAGILSARRSGQYTSLRRVDYERPEEMSVLAHIIDITQDVRGLDCHHQPSKGGPGGL
ncbi:Nucleotidyltransferase [Gymnopus androsaceus JB14]|uniref:polynucleotide adenylyltransferase n=1 Tax=Gymnopus androsaceus JB14 TaxID=1447944 RepID=A0A6A4GYG9_9AGAR|nr:Nucleotidyltransferase [Gymnopus androsaceus JB14]